MGDPVEETIPDLFAVSADGPSRLPGERRSSCLPPLRRRETRRSAQLA